MKHQHTALHLLLCCMKAHGYASVNIFWQACVIWSRCGFTVYWQMLWVVAGTKLRLKPLIPSPEVPPEMRHFSQCPLSTLAKGPFNMNQGSGAVLPGYAPLHTMLAGQRHCHWTRCPQLPATDSPGGSGLMTHQARQAMRPHRPAGCASH